jgi:predicted nucleic acid-binding protein
LHVATAIHLKAGRFVTFDKHQAALAKAASLEVQP